MRWRTWTDNSNSVCIRLCSSPGRLQSNLLQSWRWNKVPYHFSFHLPSHQLAGCHPSAKYSVLAKRTKRRTVTGGQRAHLSCYLGMFWKTGMGAILLPKQSWTVLLTCHLSGVRKMQFCLHLETACKELLLRSGRTTVPALATQISLKLYGDCLNLKLL